MSAGLSGGVGGNVHVLHSKILNIRGVIRSVVALFLYSHMTITLGVLANTIITVLCKFS